MNIHTVDRDLFDFDCSYAVEKLKTHGMLNNTAIVHYGKDERKIIDIESMEGAYPQKREEVKKIAREIGSMKITQMFTVVVDNVDPKKEFAFVQMFRKDQKPLTRAYNIWRDPGGRILNIQSTGDEYDETDIYDPWELFE